MEEQLGITNQPCEKYFRNFERDVLERHLDWLAPDHYSPQHDRFVTSVHSWLIRSGDLTILIDTCGGNHKDRPWTHRFHQLDTPYLQRLRAAGVAPEDIDMVLCTHLHADHVGWNTMLRDGRWVPTFPNAKYLFSRTDDAYWDVRKNPAMANDPRHMAYEDSVLPVVQSGQAVLVDDGYNVTSKLSVEAAPGPFARPCPVQACGCGQPRRVLRRRHPSRAAGLRAALEPHGGRAAGRRRGVAPAAAGILRRARCAAVSDPFRRAACGARSRKGRTASRHGSCTARREAV